MCHSTCAPLFLEYFVSLPQGLWFPILGALFMPFSLCGITSAVRACWNLLWSLKAQLRCSMPMWSLLWFSQTCCDFAILLPWTPFHCLPWLYSLLVVGILGLTSWCVNSVRAGTGAPHLRHLAYSWCLEYNFPDWTDCMTQRPLGFSSHKSTFNHFTLSSHFSLYEYLKLDVSTMLTYCCCAPHLGLWHTFFFWARVVHLCLGSLRAMTVNNESIIIQPRGKHNYSWLARLR